MPPASANSPSSPGFISSLGSLADGLVESLHDRIELISVELQEEKFRLIQIFIWISAAIFTGMMAITFASLTLVYLFWETARLAVLGGLALFYAGAVVAIVLGLRHYLSRQPKLFDATRQELREDLACIRSES